MLSKKSRQLLKKFFFFSTGLFIILLIIIFGLYGGEIKPTKTISFFDLEKYYQAHSKEFIVANNFDEKLKFSIHAKQFGDIFSNDPIYPKDHYQNQNYFQFKLEKFIKSEQKETLREAKISYVKKLKFVKEDRQYKRPFHYLESWGSLFHPPIEKIKLMPRLVDPLWDYVNNFDDSLFSTSDFQINLDRLSETQLTSNNTIKYLGNGDSLLPLLDIIKVSEKFLFIQMLGFDCYGTSVNKIITELESRVLANVDVRLLVDKLYSNLFGECIASLKAKGIEVIEVANHLSKLKPSMHSSIVLNDKLEMMIGAQSVYYGFYESSGQNFLDRDDSLYVKGAATTDALKEFLTIWEQHRTDKNRSLKGQIGKNKFDYKNFISNQILLEDNRGDRGQSHYNDWFKQEKFRGLCRFVAQNPLTNKSDIKTSLMEYSKSANKSIGLGSVKFFFPLQENKKSTAQEFITLFHKKALNDNISVDFFGNGIDGGNGELTMEINRWLELWWNRILTYKDSSGISNWFKEKFSQLLYNILFKLKDSIDLKQSGINFLQYEKMANVKNTTVWTNFNFSHHKSWSFDRNVFAISSLLFSDDSFESFYDAGVICMDHNENLEFQKARALDIANSIPYGEWVFGK